MKEFFAKRKDRIFAVLLTALAFPIVIFFEAPLEIYGSNIQEMPFSLSDFMPFCILFWLVGAFLVAAVLYVLPEVLYRFVFPMTAVTGFLFFLQGTYLNFGVTSLPGDNLGGGYNCHFYRRYQYADLAGA